MALHFILPSAALKSTTPDPGEAIARILLRHARGTMRPEELNPDTALIGGGLDLASIELMEAIVEIEVSLDVSLQDDELTLAVLSSFSRFVDFVCSRRP